MSSSGLRIDPENYAPRGRARQRYGDAVLSSHELGDPLRDHLADSLGVDSMHQHDRPRRSHSDAVDAVQSAVPMDTQRIDTDVEGHALYAPARRALSDARDTLREAEHRTERSMFDALPSDAPSEAYDLLQDARYSFSAAGNPLEQLQSSLYDQVSSLRGELEEQVQAHHGARFQRGMEREGAADRADDTADASSNAFYREFLGGMADHRSHKQLQQEIEARIGHLAAQHVVTIQSALERALAHIQQVETTALIRARALCGGSVERANGGSIQERLARLNSQKERTHDSRRADELYDVQARSLVSDRRERFK